MNDEAKVVLRKLQASGLEYSLKATALAKLIEEVESVLMDMDGKVAAGVNISENTRINFSRQQKGWGLTVLRHGVDEYGDDWATTTPLRDASVAIKAQAAQKLSELIYSCLLYTSPSPRDQRGSRMPSSA